VTTAFVLDIMTLFRQNALSGIKFSILENVVHEKISQGRAWIQYN
jgi:hypothetical protein